MKFFKGSALLLIIGGLLSGFINGLLGAGGGIIIVFVLSRALKDNCEQRDIFANALCVMLPISIFSCVTYSLSGKVSFDGFLPFIIPTTLGGLTGGYLLSKLKTNTLKNLFAILIAISGIILILK